MYMHYLNDQRTLFSLLSLERKVVMYRVWVWGPPMWRFIRSIQDGQTLSLPSPTCNAIHASIWFRADREFLRGPRSRLRRPSKNGRKANEWVRRFVLLGACGLHPRGCDGIMFKYVFNTLFIATDIGRSDSGPHCILLDRLRWPEA